MRLVLIGGGFVNDSNNFQINKKIVEIDGKISPRVLFIPTAMNDDENYIIEFVETYEGRLGCQVEVLRSINHNPSDDEIKNRINSADLIYLGGGNYIKMIEQWKKYKIDTLLLEALKNETLIAGISAGAICWFKSGLRTNYGGEGYLESSGWGMVKHIFWLRRYT